MDHGSAVVPSTTSTQRPVAFTVPNCGLFNKTHFSINFHSLSKQKPKYEQNLGSKIEV